LATFLFAPQKNFGAVAQLGEHLVRNEGVESSNLFSSTNFLRQSKKLVDAASSVASRQGEQRDAALTPQ
jgi:hypothetical protein